MVSWRDHILNELNSADNNLIIAVDPLIDMGRTLVNVIGAGVVATIVAKREKELDFDMLNSHEVVSLSE